EVNGYSSNIHNNVPLYEEYFLWKAPQNKKESFHLGKS
ncbi:MAG: hypothetical protein Sylvanvirus35_9, partial [Sylvanvirus sp.]